jgi:hypothetical protein
MTPSPLAEYEARLAARRGELDRESARLDRLGRGRLAVFAAGVVVALVGYASDLFPAWVGFFALPPFAWLAVRYDTVHQRITRKGRAVRFYEHGLARLAGKWAGIGSNGSQFADPDHLYAADLDLFGPGSLFQRLNSARTAAGEERLAAWLKEPAEAAEVLARQEAVAELRPRLDLREALAVAGADVPHGVPFAELAAWGAAPGEPVAVWRRTAVFLLGGVNCLALLGWLLAGTGRLPFLLSFAASLAAAWPLFGWARRVLRPVEEIAAHLGLLETILARLEAERFAAPRLVELQASLTAGGVPPSAQLRHLRALTDWYDARRNVLFVPLRVLLLWDVRMAFRFEDWRRRSGPAVGRWLAAVADAEALSSLAGYAFENPADPFPGLAEDATFAAERLAHPLLSPQTAVRNDVALGNGVRLLVVSGSNMSGKSTLLRAVGANAVLALAGGPVRAARLRLSPVALGATIRVQDSLQEGRSRFFAEVTRVRAILDRAAGPVPVLFLLDELFAGTNSADRLRGAEGVIRALLDRGAVGLVTTHDLALTDIVARLGGRAGNVHFTDQVVNGELAFDYAIRPGVVPHGNGVTLMRAVGLDV